MENVSFVDPLAKGSWHEWPQAAPCRFARLALIQHEPIGCFQRDMEAVQAHGTGSVWRRVGWQLQQAFGPRLLLVLLSLTGFAHHLVSPQTDGIQSPHCVE